MNYYSDTKITQSNSVTSLPRIGLEKLYEIIEIYRKTVITNI